jgi:hypothetical protein
LRTVAPSVVTTNTGIVVCKCIVGYEKACILVLISVLYQLSTCRPEACTCLCRPCLQEGR